MDLLLCLYSRAVDEVGADRFEQAFLAVLENSPFRPDIADIRRAAGINRGVVDPIEASALHALAGVVILMRRHGPRLAPIPGRVIADRDEAGLVLVVPRRSAPEPAPDLGEATEAALVDLGLGDRQVGLDLVAAHPALPWNAERAGETPANYRLKAQQEIERRWCAAYMRVAGVR